LRQSTWWTFSWPRHTSDPDSEYSNNQDSFNGVGNGNEGSDNGIANGRFNNNEVEVQLDL
jgi:hypothetical protein